MCYLFIYVGKYTKIYFSDSRRPTLLVLKLITTNNYKLKCTLDYTYKYYMLWWFTWHTK